ncbi:hypothetical protein [Thermospira aquatica]|uniref:Uncharacterized protein n=1 Tax=Thermospira aquatica TaxID=2828656 RepID=A0AAX3BDF7_9SPIR|nr:hypothetical protein [Thermospira aquatica]URA10372.1 hypothetical protein KDW03_00780 [Thermospira aquatica]
MFSKKIGIILVFVFWGFLWGEKNWRVGICAFVDISAESDEVIGMILQSSLEGVLRRNKRFQVMIVSNAITNLSQARSVGTAARLDVLIYGFYRREGRDFVVMVKIYDILENEVRLSKTYKGVHSRDIFETVDEIASEASEEIKRALPVLLTEEDVARIQAQRKEIYEPKEVTIRREMRLGIGMVATGTEMWFERWDTMNLTSSYSGHSTLFSPEISLSMQIEWLRLAFVMKGLPWLPTWYNLEAYKGEFYGDYNQPISSVNGITLSDVLWQSLFLKAGGVFPLHRNLWIFAGVGGFGGSFSPVPQAEEVRINEGGGILLDGGVLSKNWEVGIMYQLWPLSQGWRDFGINPDVQWKESSTLGTTYNLSQYNFPLIAIYGNYFFFPQLGVALRLKKIDMQRNFEYFRTDSGSSKSFMRVDSVDISLEVNYRFKFGF